MPAFGFFTHLAGKYRLPIFENLKKVKSGGVAYSISMAVKTFKKRYDNSESLGWGSLY
jgi:hypothetical protein